MAYLLATMDSRVRWYIPNVQRVEDILTLKADDFRLVDQLNLDIVPGFGNKNTAKRVAQALGLKTWRYVQLDSPKHTLTLSE